MTGELADLVSHEGSVLFAGGCLLVSSQGRESTGASLFLFL